MRCALLLTYAFRLSSLIELKEDTVIVVLGASGDLAKKKTVSIDCVHYSVRAMFLANLSVNRSSQRYSDS